MEAKSSFKSDPGANRPKSFEERFAALKNERSKSQDATGGIVKYDHGLNITVIKLDNKGKAI
jgi:hypothetical protein